MIVLKSGVPKLRIDELAFSPDGAMIAAPGEVTGVCLWTAPTDNPKAELLKVPIRGVSLLAFAPNGTLYAGSDELCAISITDRTSPRIADRFAITPWSSLWFGASPDGSRLVVATRERGQESNRIRAWAAGEFRDPLWEVVIPGDVIWTRPLFTLDGESFVMCELYRDATRRWRPYQVVRSTATGEELDRSPSLAETPEQTVRSPDGQTLACRVRGTISIYPMLSATPDAVIKNDGTRYYTGMAWHPTGKYLAATSNDETVKLYDATTWKHLRTFTWDIGRMRSVCFSPDGTLAAAGSDRGKVVVWDVDV
ncbi:MAG TPA: WD40 repeat domain-containing protein [Gemmataceae bacterium]|nr:WD40 repeat domain-containing protein [Gemmataceae bacterium]